MSEVIKTDRRSVLKVISAASAVGVAGCAGDTGEYPDDTIDYIIPFSEGGGTDNVARQIVPVMSEILEQSVAIENIEGAASLRGTGELYYSDPDGYTIGAFNPPSTPIAALVNPPDYDMREMEGICTYGRTAYCLYGDSEQVEDYEDLQQQYADGSLDIIGGEQVGSSAHVAAAVLQNEGLEWEQYVGYDGSGPSAQNVAAGEVPAGISSDSAGEGFVEDGQMEVLAYLTTEPTPMYPDAPMIGDYGVRDMDFTAELLRGMYAPPDTDEEYLETIADSVEEALEDPDVQEFAEDSGNVLEFGPGEDAEQGIEDTFSEVPEAVDLDEIREEN